MQPFKRLARKFARRVVCLDVRIEQQKITIGEKQRIFEEHRGQIRSLTSSRRSECHIRSRNTQDQDQRLKQQ